MALDSFAQDILNRCRIAKSGYGGHPYGTWSERQQLAVALVLGDLPHLTAMDYTTEAAMEWVRVGLSSPPADMDAWLDAIREKLEA